MSGTPLHTAASRRGPELQRLLAEGADPDAADTLGRRPLHHAVRVDVDHVRHLLAAGADPNAADSSGLTPLHFAVSVGGWCLEPLLQAGATVDAQDLNGHTALHHAVHGNHQQAVSTLLVAGADPRRPDHTGETPLDMIQPVLGSGTIDEMWLADAQHHGPDRLAAHLRELIEKGLYNRILMVLDPSLCPGHHSAVARRGRLPLADWTGLAVDLAAFCGERGAWLSLHALHTAGLPVPLPEPMRGRAWRRQDVSDVPLREVPAALVQAALEGRAAFVVEMDPGGAAPGLEAALFALQKAVLQRTPAPGSGEWAALEASQEALLRAGARLEARAGEAAAALHRSLALPHDEAGDPRWDDERNLAQRHPGFASFASELARAHDHTPLLFAVEARSVLLPHLLAAGADREVVDRFGRNALHLACSAGGVLRAAETVAALLDAGFAVDEPAPGGWRPLTLASNPKVVALLISRGAEPRLSPAERERLGPKGTRRLDALLRR